MVAEQTSIIADERLDAYVEGDTRIDGAILASLTGDLTLDTGTLSFTDIEDRARFNAASAQLGISLGAGLPGVNLSGEIAEAETDAVNRATIGEGEIRIRDEAAQTQDVAALNRDLDRAQETTRDEAAGVRFYVSDTAVREIASGFAETRANLEETRQLMERGLAGISQDVLDSVEEAAEALGLASGTVEEITQALIEEQVAAGDLSQEDADKLAAFDALLEGDDRLYAYASCAVGACGGDISIDPELARRQLATLRTAAQAVAAAGMTLAGGSLVALLAMTSPTGGRFENTVVSPDGTRVTLRGYGAESTATMEIVAPNGDRTLLSLTRYGNNFVLTDAAVVSANGRLTPIDLMTAADVAKGLAGPVGGGFQAQPQEATILVTPVHVNGITILITPPAGRQPTAMITPIPEIRNDPLITPIPDFQLPWVLESTGFYDPQAWRQNYENFYGDGVTSTTVPPYSKPNVRLAGQKHPETGIVFDQRGFPIFDDIAVHDTRIMSGEFALVGHRGQMRMATRELRSFIQQNPEYANQFDADQLQAIRGGRPSIPRLTWHHHQDSGRMQLVPRDFHKQTGHVGGEAMTGGR